jgi:hypothetical protein
LAERGAEEESVRALLYGSATSRQNLDHGIKSIDKIENLVFKSG